MNNCNLVDLHPNRVDRQPARFAPVKPSNVDDITYQTITSGHRSWSLFSDGTVLRLVRGGDEPTPPAPLAPAPPAAPDLGALQAAIDQAKTGGASEATADLMKALGFDKLEDAQAFVTAKREADDKLLSEVERREKAAADREAAAQQRETDAAKLIERGVIRNALQSAGVTVDNLDDAEGLVKITGDVTADSAKAAVELVKAKPAFASLFTATEEGDEGNGTGAPSGVTTGSKAGKGGDKNAKTALERGAERWRDKAKKTSTAA